VPRVLVCQGVLYRKLGKFAEIFERAGFEVRFPEPGGGVLSEQELLDNLQGVDAAMASMEPWTARVLERIDRLRVISRFGVGYDSVDVPAASRRDVVVAITPDCNHEAVAEHTMALLLGAAKRLLPGHQIVERGEFRRQPTLPVRGRTLGLVGAGKIGREVARRGAAFGMQILFSTRQTPGGQLDRFTVVPLDELLARSDFVSLHLPLNEATRHLFDAATIERMKPGAILINTARGGIVDEAALADALHSGHLAAAAVDVFQKEPPGDSPLLTAPNVLFSPHLGGADQASFDCMARTAIETIVDLYEGRWPADRIVNAADLSTPWRW